MDNHVLHYLKQSLVMVAAVQKTANSHNGQLGVNVQLLEKVCAKVNIILGISKHNFIVPQ